MKIVRTGIIINTENYEACVKFYQEIFSLPVLFTKTDGDFKLTCFEYGGSYLMLENDGFANPAGKSIKECAAMLRFNVEDLSEALQRLKNFGIDAKIENYDWGSTIHIFDPDGNRVGIRNETKFMAK